MERVWRSRLRWRIRGAWMWPTFVVLTVADGVLLHELPVSGDGVGVLPGVLVAGFSNLFAVAVLAPLIGRLLRRRRPDLPRLIATDYAGTVLLLAVTGALVAAGLIHRPAVIDRERGLAAGVAQLRDYVLANGSAVHRRNAARIDVLKVNPDFYRACVPAADPTRAICFFIDLTRHPVRARHDPNPVANSAWLNRAGATGR
jgi:hypothetical protein